MAISPANFAKLQLNQTQAKKLNLFTGTKSMPSGKLDTNLPKEPLDVFRPLQEGPTRPSWRPQPWLDAGGSKPDSSFDPRGTGEFWPTFPVGAGSDKATEGSKTDEIWPTFPKSSDDKKATGGFDYRGTGGFELKKGQTKSNPYFQPLLLQDPRRLGQ